MTQQEREKVAALVENAYLEGEYDGRRDTCGTWKSSAAKEALDALLAETPETCRWTRDKWLVKVACDGSRHPGLIPDLCPGCGRHVEVVEAP